MTVVSSGWVVLLFISSRGVCGVSFSCVFLRALCFLSQICSCFDGVFGEEVDLFFFGYVGRLNVHFYWGSLNVVSY